MKRVLWVIVLSLLLFSISGAQVCSYHPGDINSDGQTIGGDVTYGVRYFKSIGPQPPDSCYMDSTGVYLYVAGDVNGNCEFRGSDITRLVAYFKGNADLGHCHFFPPPEVLPVLTTAAVSGVTQTTAECGGIITSDGGTSVAVRGVCWSTDSTPTITDNKTIDGAGVGSFTSSITGLADSTAYYVRAYATNSAGTGYGNTISFITFPPPIISDNVVVFQDTGNVHLDSIEGTTFRYTFTGTAPDLEVGDILIESTGGGYLRRVTAVTIIADSMMVSTDSACLTDAIIRGNFHANVVLNPLRIFENSGRYLSEPNYFAPGVSLRDGGFDFSGVTLYSSPSASLEIANGQFNFSPVLDFGLFINNRNVDSFWVTAGGSVDLSLDLEASAYLVNIEDTVSLAVVHFAPIYTFIGYVPVIIVPTMRVVAGYEFEAGTITLTTGFSGSALMEFGAKYQNTTWSAIWNRNLNLVGHGMDWSGPLNTHLKGYLQPLLTFKIYSIAGPYLKAGPFSQFESSFEPPHWSWTLAGGAEGYIGADIRMFNRDLLNWEHGLFTNQIELGSDSGTVGPSKPSDPSPPNGYTDHYVVDSWLHWVCTGQEGDTISYDVYFGMDSIPPLVSPNQSQARYNPGQLQFATPYYWKIVARDNHGYETSGDVWHFTTMPETSTVTDIDGNVYRTIAIGHQVWMAENLRVTHYRNGVSIPNVTDSAQWGLINYGAYCNYDNNEANVAVYGRLYNWGAVCRSWQLSQYSVAPTGWHLPDDDDWEELINYLGGDTIAGGMMKEAGTIHWDPPNTGATNASRFTGLPGGMRRGESLPDGVFQGLRENTHFWSSVFFADPDFAWTVGLSYTSKTIFWNIYPNHRDGMSVRCVRDY